MKRVKGWIYARAFGGGFFDMCVKDDMSEDDVIAFLMDDIRRKPNDFWPGHERDLEMAYRYEEEKVY